MSGRANRPSTRTNAFPGTLARVLLPLTPLSLLRRTPRGSRCPVATSVRGRSWIGQRGGGGTDVHAFGAILVQEPAKLQVFSFKPLDVCTRPPSLFFAKTHGEDVRRSHATATDNTPSFSFADPTSAAAVLRRSSCAGTSTANVRSKRGHLWHQQWQWHVVHACAGQRCNTGGSSHCERRPVHQEP